MTDVDPGEAAKGAGEGIQKAAGSKILGVDLWIWILGGAALVAVVLYLRANAANGGGASNIAGGVGGIPPILGGGGSSGGGSASPTSTPSPANSPTTNLSWLTQAVANVSQGLGIDAATAQAYLSAYLNGATPAGNANAVTMFDRVINAAVNSIGAPPQGTATPSSTQGLFATASQYIQAGLAEVAPGIQGGISASVRNELQALGAGSTNTISQDAANVLQQIEGVYGNFAGLTYQITAPPAATPAGPTGNVASAWGPLLTQIENDFQSVRPLGIGASSPFATGWTSEVAQAFGVPQAVAHQLYAEIAANPAQYQASSGGWNGSAIAAELDRLAKAPA